MTTQHRKPANDDEISEFGLAEMAGYDPDESDNVPPPSINQVFVCALIAAVIFTVFLAFLPRVG